MRQVWGVISLLLLVTFGGLVNAAIVSEITWASLGVDAFSVDGIDQVDCQKVSFNWDDSFQQNGVFSVLTIVANFGPVNEGAAQIHVRVNPDQNQLPDENRSFELRPTDFNGRNYHAVINSNWFVVGSNTIHICPQTSNSITRIQIAPNTRIGLYRMPYFAPQDFTKTIDRATPIVGEEAQISIKAKNSGSEDAQVKIEFRDLELKVLQITRGDSDFDGIIKAGQEVTLTYFVKPKFAAHMTPVSAKLVYTDVFGDEQVIRSTRPQFKVEEPPFHVTGLLIAPEKNAKPHESITVQLSIKNTGENELNNLTVRLKNIPGVTQSPKEWVIPSLRGGETQTLSTNISSDAEGKFNISCQIESEAGSQSVNCDQISISFENEAKSPVLLLIAGLVLIGAIIYAYVYHVPKKKEVA